MIRNILFDVDGTLWDSAEAVAASWNHVLRTQFADLHRPALTTQDMYQSMGKTMTEIGLQRFPDLSPALRDQVMKAAMAYENAYLREHPGHYYDGLTDTLRQLRVKGLQLFIVSNCQDGYIEALLSHHDLQQFFKDWECFGRTNLPKDGSIRILMQRDHLLPEETIYVGDTQMDEAAAGKAGIRFIHAQYGFGTAAAPAAEISDIRDLPGVIPSLPQ